MCCFLKQLSIKTISNWHYNKIIFQSIKIVPCIWKVHLFDIKSDFLQIHFDFNYTTVYRCQKTFFHVHQTKSNLFVSITFIFLLPLIKKYKITSFDFHFLVDMQSKFSSVKTMRGTSHSSSITYAWRRLFVFKYCAFILYELEMIGLF